MKYLMSFAGILDAVTDKSGAPYPPDDWRCAYLHLPGSCAVYQSEHKAPGKVYLCFLPYEPRNPMQRYLRTSAGLLTVGADRWTMTTHNSIYSILTT